jgi:WXG100 family type VII secretion target
MAFKVTSQILSAGAAASQQTADEISSQLANLKSYVIGLEPVWQGPASTTFQELMGPGGRYDQLSGNIVQLLTDVSQVLQQNAANYTDGEQVNLTGMQQIESGL